jgi:hypothetical protein
VALTCSTFKLHPLIWWEVDGIEPLAREGLRLQRSDGTSLSLPALPVLSGARRLGDVAHIVAPSSCREGRREENWRKREVLIPNGLKTIHLASNERRTPVWLRFQLSVDDLADG